MGKVNSLATVGQRVVQIVKKQVKLDYTPDIET